MVTIDNLVTQGSVMPDNLRSDTARATLEYKNQLKNAGDIYVGTGTKITNDEAGVEREIYVTEGTNIQTALNEDIFRVGGKNNIGLTNSDLSAHSNNIGIGKDISVNSDNNILIGNSTLNSGTNSAIIIGGGSITDNSSITIGNNAKSIGPDAQMITIGNNAENNGYRGVAIGSYASVASGLGFATTGVALGYNAKVNAANAAQIGSGTNSVANSLKFRDTEIVDGSGNVNATKINKVLSTDIFEDDGKMVKNAKTAEVTDFTNSEFQKVDFELNTWTGQYEIPANTFDIGTYEIKIYRKEDYDIDKFLGTCLAILFYTFEDKNDVVAVEFNPEWSYQKYGTETDRQLTLTYFRFLLGNGGMVSSYTRYTGIAAEGATVSSHSVVSNDYRIRIRQIR